MTYKEKNSKLLTLFSSNSFNFPPIPPTDATVLSTENDEVISTDDGFAIEVI